MKSGWLAVPLFLLASDAAARPVITELWRGTNLSTGDEWIELVLVEDHTAAELEQYFVGDSSAATEAKFSAYRFAGMDTLAAEFPAGTIIVVAGTAASAEDLAYDPYSGDWNLVLRPGSANLAVVTGGGDLAATDVAWVDTASAGATLAADGFAVNWDDTPGAFGAVASVTIPPPVNNSGAQLTSATASATVPASWTVSVAVAAMTPGQPNGGANTVDIDAMRALDRDGDGFGISQGDCNDDDATINPDVADDVCDGIDQDCNGMIDDGSVGTPWYPDLDGDGFGEDLARVLADSEDEFSGVQGGDGWSYGSYPAFSPLLFAALPFFDGAVHHGSQPFSTPFVSATSAHPGVDDFQWAVRRWTADETVSAWIDVDALDLGPFCNDGANVRVWHDDVEIWNANVAVGGTAGVAGLALTLGVGDTIDLIVDPIFDTACDEVELVATLSTDDVRRACADPGQGWAAIVGDCDDALAGVNPDVPEMGCNGIDDDCNPATPDIFDGDRDGFDACMDCDDDDPTVFPGADEACNGVDDDCDQELDEGCGGESSGESSSDAESSSGGETTSGAETTSDGETTSGAETTSDGGESTSSGEAETGSTTLAETDGSGSSGTTTGTSDGTDTGTPADTSGSADAGTNPTSATNTASGTSEADESESSGTANADDGGGCGCRSRGSNGTALLLLAPLVLLRPRRRVDTRR